MFGALKLTEQIYYRCIPFRYRDSDVSGNSNSEKIVEVLMINSTSGPGLLFPKVISSFFFFLKIYFDENCYLFLVHFSASLLIKMLWSLSLCHTRTHTHTHTHTHTQ